MIQLGPAERGDLTKARSACLAKPTAKQNPNEWFVRLGSPLVTEQFVACRTIMNAEHPLFRDFPEIIDRRVVINTTYRMPREVLLPLRVTLDGSPRRWQPARLKRALADFIGGLHVVDGPRRAQVRLLPSSVPPIPLGCQRAIYVPSGWEVQKVREVGRQVIFSEKGGRRRLVVTRPIAQADFMRPTRLQNAFSEWTGNTPLQVSRAPGSFIATGANDRTSFTLTARVTSGCEQMLSVFVAGTPDEGWSPQALFDLFFVGAGPEVSEPMAAAASFGKPGAIAAATESRDPGVASAVARWVKVFKGKQFGSGSGSAHVQGRASNGYSGGAARGSVAFCANGRVTARKTEGFYASTPYGGGGKIENSHLEGAWGVFEIAGKIYLYLFLTGGSKAIELPTRLAKRGHIIRVGGVVFNVADLEIGAICV